MTLFDCRPGYECSEYNGLYPSMSDWFDGENGTVATRMLTGKVLPSDESSSERRDEDAEKTTSAEILDWLALSEQDWNWTSRRCQLSTVSYIEHETVTGAHSVAPSTFDQRSFQLVSGVRTRGLPKRFKRTGSIHDRRTTPRMLLHDFSRSYVYISTSGFVPKQKCRA